MRTAYNEKVEEAPMTVKRRMSIVDDALNQINVEDDVLDEEKEPENTSRSHTWSTSNSYIAGMLYYVAQTLIKRVGKDVLIIDEKSVFDYEYDYQKSANILTIGSLVFNYKDKLYAFTCDIRQCSFTIHSNFAVAEIVEMIDKEIKENNPLRRKNVYLFQDGGSISAEFRKMPQITFDNVILKPEIAEDIFDNTIFQIENLSGTNGIILYGDPGCGKSHGCQAIIAEAVKRGISTCFTTTEVDYIELMKIIEMYLDPCILIIEDIDSIAQDREKVVQTRIATFLQFLSGLSETSARIVFVATTNHLEHLDNAVRNRPMRFNRKIKVPLPDKGEIDRLVDLYFGADFATPEMKKKCYITGFTGAHIKEINRTCNLLSKKTNQPLLDVFDKAVEIVKEHFSVASNYMEKNLL